MTDGVCPRCKAPIKSYPDVVDEKFENVALSAKALRPHNCRTFAVWGEAFVNGDGAQ